MFDTPKEAILKAENDKLKAENAYLKRAFTPNMISTPIAVIEEITVRSLNDTITLPCVASIHGGLSRYGNYHVLAKTSWAQPEDLKIQYHAPAMEIKGLSDYAINNLLPFMHERFIHALAQALRKNG